MNKYTKVFIVSVASLTLSTTILESSTITTIDPFQETIVSAKAQNATLIPGTYKVGKELKPGRYQITSTDGTSGNISSTPKRSLHGDAINEILGSDTEYAQTPTVDATLERETK